MSQLNLLKNQIEQVVQKYNSYTTLHKLSLSIPKSRIEGIQNWLRALTEKDLEIITPRTRKTILRRTKDICDLQYLVFALDLEKNQLKIKIGFVNRFFCSLVQLKAPKLWEELDV